MTRALRASVLLVAALAAGAGVAEADSEREKLERRIEELGRALGKADKRLQGELARLGDVERKLAALAKRVDAAERERDRLAVESRTVERRISALSNRIAARIDGMGNRLSAAYRLRQGGWLQVLFGDGDLMALPARLDALALIVRHDRGWIADQEALLAKRAAARRRLESVRARSDKKVEELEALGRELRAERKERARLVASLRTDRRRYKRELSDARDALKEALARLKPSPRIARGPGDVERLKGYFARPVQGRVLEGFGRDASGRYARNGLVFAVRPGDVVLAAQDGTVLYSGWFRGYGQMMVVDHGAGLLSVYAHLQELFHSSGESVLKADPIGRAGDTGSPKGPRLYFEIRRQGTALDPTEWFHGGG